MNSQKIKVSPRWVVIVCLTLLVTLLSFGVAQAAVFDRDGRIEANETINDDVFLGGDNVVMDGTVNGILFAGGNRITISGTVNGDVFLGANTVVISDTAKINGNLFVGGQDINLQAGAAGSVFVGGSELIISGKVNIERNLYFGGYSLLADRGTTIEKDLLVGSYQVIFDGEVGQNAKLGAAAVELNGKVNGNLSVDLGNNEESMTPNFYMPSFVQLPSPIQPGLRISKDAKVGGKLEYTSQIDQSAYIQGQLASPAVWMTPMPGEVQPERQPIYRTTAETFATTVFDILRSLVTLLLLGGLGLWLLPKFFQKSVDQAGSKPLLAGAVGFLSILVGYVGAFLAFLVILLVGILLAVLTLGGLSATILVVGILGLILILFIFTVIIIWISKLVVAYLGGQWIMQKLAPQAPWQKIWALAIGVVIYVLLAAIPYIGWIVSLVVTLIGMGALWYAFQSRQKISTPLSTSDVPLTPQG